MQQRCRLDSVLVSVSRSTGRAPRRPSGCHFLTLMSHFSQQVAVNWCERERGWFHVVIVVQTLPPGVLECPDAALLMSMKTVCLCVIGSNFAKI